jgi:integrase
VTLRQSGRCRSPPDFRRFRDKRRLSPKCASPYRRRWRATSRSTAGKQVVNGEKVWVIDRRFRRSDGATERYRRAAQVQTRDAAEAEERRIKDYFVAHGTIGPLLVKAEPKVPEKTYTWDDAVELYKKTELPLRKPSVRVSYGAILKQAILKYWDGRPLVEITKAEQKKWETWATGLVPNPGTRLKHHIVLRSVMRSVGPDEDDDGPGLMLAEPPRFIRMPKPNQTAIQVPHPEDVAKIMNEGRDGRIPKHCRSRSLKRAQLAYALALWCGLRAGEVRALRKFDVDERRRVITIRRSKCAGEETVTKGRAEREVPVADLLWERLEPRLREIGDEDVVCVNLHGRPWSDTGIYDAFVRSCKRLGIKGSRYHACRHYFATALFGGGADAITVQGLLGHQDLTTTQRYAHFVADRAKKAIAVFSVNREINAGVNANPQESGSILN